MTRVPVDRNGPAIQTVEQHWTISTSFVVVIIFAWQGLTLNETWIRVPVKNTGPTVQG